LCDLLFIWIPFVHCSTFPYIDLTFTILPHISHCSLLRLRITLHVLTHTHLCVHTLFSTRQRFSSSVLTILCSRLLSHCLLHTFTGSFCISLSAILSSFLLHSIFLCIFLIGSAPLACVHLFCFCTTALSCSTPHLPFIYYVFFFFCRFARFAIFISRSFFPALSALLSPHVPSPLFIFCAACCMRAHRSLHASAISASYLFTCIVRLTFSLFVACSSLISATRGRYISRLPPAFDGGATLHSHFSLPPAFCWVYATSSHLPYSISFYPLLVTQTPPVTLPAFHCYFTRLHTHHCTALLWVSYLVINTMTAWNNHRYTHEEKAASWRSENNHGWHQQ